MSLLERDKEIAFLKERAKDCIAGKSSIVNIFGEAGIGKTSLVDYFLDYLEGDFCVCRGYCESLFTPRPFGPVYDMRTELGVSFPETLNSDNKAIIFDRFRYGIVRKDKPVLLVFEDVHWADEATLDLIRFLGRRIEQFQCVLLFTHRDNALEKGHPLSKVLAVLSTKNIHRLKIAPLTKDTVLNLAIGKDLSGQRLFELTRGNPFFVFEMLKSKRLEISENLKDLIISGLSNVTALENEVLSLIALFPQNVAIDFVHRIVHLPNIHKAMDALVGRELIYTDGLRVYFKHELVRLAIYDAIYPIEKMELHRRILEVLLKNSETETTLSEIVHHAIKSRNLDAICKYAPKAAAEASKWGAHLQALDLYGIAIENGKAKNSIEHAELLEAYSHECYLTNQLQEGTQAIKSAIQIWERFDTIRTGHAYALSSRLLWFSGAGTMGLSHGRKAIEILEAYPQKTTYLANAYANYGHILALSFKLKEAYIWNRKALALSQERNEKQIYAFANSNISLLDIHYSLESYNKGLDNLKDALALGLEVEDQGLVGRIYVNLYFNYLITGNIEVAHNLVVEIKEFLLKNDLDLFFYVIKSLESILFRFKGEWPKAVKIANETLKSPHKNQHTSIAAILTKSTIAARMGNSDALELLKQGSLLALKSGEYQFVVPFVAAILEYEWLTGKSFPDRGIIKLALELSKTHHSIWYDSLLNFWLNKVGLPELTKVGWTNTDLGSYQKTLNEVIMAWFNSVVYYKALVLSDGDARDRKKALNILVDLGAEASIMRIKRDLREKGIKRIPRGIRSSTRDNPEQLTNRQLEILLLLRDGMTNSEIADKLFISSKTVDNHVSAILDKFGVGSRAKAVLAAKEKGVLK